MATIPWHETWMRDTYSRFDSRSDLLKAVDLAIFVYDSDKSEESRLGIKRALDAYIAGHEARNKDWKASVRNKKGAVSNLHRAVNNLDARALTQVDLDAIKAAVELQQAALKAMFLGKHMQLRGMSKKRHSEEVAKFLKNAQGMAANIRDLSMTRSGTAANQGVNVVAGTAVTDKFHQLVQTVCGALDPETVMRALGLNSVTEFARSMAPALGIIASASDTAVGLCKIAWQSYKAAEFREASTWTLAPGDPLAAFHALETLLDREINSTIASTTIAAGAFTAKMLCGALDLGAASGPAIGLAETIAKAIQRIREFVRDWGEVQKANALLEAGTFGIGLFQTCPILGCYFLVVQDHSTVINMAVADYGTPRWMMDVERMMTAARPVLAKAGEFVRASPFEIPGMENYKGIKQVAWERMTKTEKAANAKQHVIDGLVDAVSKKKKPPPKPTFGPGRIVGFGSDNPPPPPLLRSGSHVDHPPPVPPRPVRQQNSLVQPPPIPPRPPRRVVAPPIPPRPVRPPPPIATAPPVPPRPPRVRPPDGPISLGEFAQQNRGALPPRFE
ncbi:MAG: hypothetical protein JWQ07_1180 [Ramlibacter sp.]|nr:hypothetical protein [Ramlibacter sp.]